MGIVGMYAPSDWPDQCTEVCRASSVKPEAYLKLEHVFGYSSPKNRAPNLFYSKEGDVVYYTAAVGIVYDDDNNRQKFFLRHDDDIQVSERGENPLESAPGVSSYILVLTLPPTWGRQPVVDQRPWLSASGTFAGPPARSGDRSAWRSTRTCKCCYFLVLWAFACSNFHVPTRMTRSNRESIAL